MNSVPYLRKNYKLLTNKQKLKIKKLGRPTPDIAISSTVMLRNKPYKRNFNIKLYEKTPWLCGCNEKNALFCFPCLLLGEDKPSMWTTTGSTDLSHFKQNVKRHESLTRHAFNVVSVALLDRVKFNMQMDSSYWVNQRKKTEQIDINRCTLSRIINTFKFCGAFELSCSQNLNDFGGLVNFTEEINKILHEHLDRAIMSNKETSQAIQNALLQCILQVCKENIAAEVAQARYIAVMVDQVTDVTSQLQMAIVFRYIRHGIPVERFWGFIKCQKHDVESLAECILSVIDPVLSQNPSKLIAQTYNGYIINSGQLKDICTLIQKKYPSAHFVHSYSHQMNLLIPQAAWPNIQVRVFFSNIDSISSFFSNSLQRTNMLNEIVGTLPPPISHKEWTLKSQCVNIIDKYRGCLIECMKKIQENSTNSKILSQANAIELSLYDREFLLWIKIFQRIMPHFDELSESVKKEEADSIKQAAKAFVSCVQCVKENIDEIIDASDLMDDSEPSPKRIRISHDNILKSALETCDTIIQTTTERFKFVDHLNIASLFTSERFYKSKIFDIPTETLSTIRVAYPNLVEIDRLIFELSVIHTHPDFQKFKGVLNFFNMLITNNLEDTFRETLTVLELIITTPMITSEADRCFPTFKNIQRFLHNIMDEETTSALAMMCLENKLMKNDDHFTNKVIEKLSSSSIFRSNLREAGFSI